MYKDSISLGKIALPDIKEESLCERTLSASEDSLVRKTKKVSFGLVYTREYFRCLSWTAVPVRGSWPLGIDWEYEEIDPVSINDFEKQKMLDIESRVKKISKKEKKNITYELRDLCHRKTPNPLFFPLKISFFKYFLSLP